MRHLLAKSAVLGLALLAAAPESHAQSADKKTGISLYGSTLQYHGDLGSEWFKSNKIEYGGGITLSRYLTPGIDIGLSANYGDMKFSSKTLQAIDDLPPAIRRFDANVTTIGVPIKFKLNNGWALKEDAIFAPYLSLTPGLMIASSDKFSNTGGGEQLLGNKDHYAAYVQGAAGIALNFSPSFGIFVQTGQIYAATNTIDNVDKGDLNDRYLQHSAGITYNFGKAKDEDMDGVPDRKDKCPATPAGVAVDEAGCPLDGDGDGVPDYQDKCPTEKGVAALEGCPDRDGDGVRDSEDECPDQAGTAALRGCPDADGDGVADKNDTCPDTPAGTQVDATGCPVVTDADGDGVNDDVDKCPGTPAGATVDANGCRVIDPALMEKVRPVQFETNSTVIRRQSFGTLDNMIKILEQYPEYSLRIAGHADSRGTNEYNQGLSERRASSAKRYFTGKQVDPNRVTTVGFGEDQPASPNTSAAGMAKNRRVEFTFEFYIPSQPQP